MVRCRDWELQRVCPWGGISAGGDLAERQEFGEQSRASLELSQCCSKGCSSITRAAEGSWAAPGSVCPGQPQTPLLFPFPLRDGDNTGTQWSGGAGGCQVSSLPSPKASDEWNCSKGFYHKKSLETPWKQKAGSLLSALCCRWAPWAPGWCLLCSSDTTKWGKLQKAPAIYSV